MTAFFLPISADPGSYEKKRSTLRSATAEDSADAAVGMSDGKHSLQSSDDEDDESEYHRLVEAGSVADSKTVEIAAKRDQQRDTGIRSIIWCVFICYSFDVNINIYYYQRIY